MYALLKTIHIASVIGSISLFAMRLIWAYSKPQRLQIHWVRIVSHAIDVVLLASAIGLTMVMHQYPFTHAWLTAKVLALVAYIICGSVALKHARSRWERNLASAAALGCVVYIVAVAINHDPFPFG
jgi:uncharacterized membrane protein SirB2